jgi:hypothetical protein
MSRAGQPIDDPAVPRTGRVETLVVAIAAAVLVGACQTSASPTPGATTSGGPVTSGAPSDPAPGTSGGPGIAAARAAIDAANLADAASLDTLDAIRFTDDGAAAAAQAITGGASGDALWAATWIYGTSGTDPAVLKPLLANDDASIRAMAAAAALSLGERAAARVLVALVTVDGNVRASHPPISIAAFSSNALAQYIAGPTIAAGVSPTDTAAAWTAWLDAHESSMQFGADTGTWTAP